MKKINLSSFSRFLERFQTNLVFSILFYNAVHNLFM